MNAFQRSWEITKLSFDVMKKDKELLLFPILGAIFSILFLIAILFPTVLIGFFVKQPSKNFVLVSYFWIILFGIYFGLAIISTFFNVCAVYTIKKRFDGKNATFGESIKFAFSKFHLIIGWSLVSAIVGIILRILENIAERLGTIGEIIMKIIISIFGVAWTLISAFVIPSMIYKNKGPIDALKDSANTFKKTWGESLIKHYGLGLIELILLILIIAGTIAFSFIFSVISIYISFFIIFIGVVLTILTLVFFSVANNVFNTALYVYATTGKAPKGYKDDVLKHAFLKKKEEDY